MIKSILYIITSFSLLISAYLKMQNDKTINYLPLGDSYTIGTGASEQESWPYLLTRHLNGSGIKFKLIDNPARNGYSTQDLMDEELPLVQKYKPDFVSLLIGVNDWVRGVPKETFKKNLIYILDEVQKRLPDKQKIILVTIPDFGVTPAGKNYSRGRNISEGISEFNKIIKQEAKNRDLVLVDIFELSKDMGTDRTLVAADGLHPSAKEYAIWEKLILAEALKLLK